MHNPSWDNLRYVLAVVEAGSVSAAARTLGVNHATVLRRISAFEAHFGGAIFDKSAAGYRLMPGNEDVVRAMHDVESGVLAVQRLMQGSNPSHSGIVRIASTDTICQCLLPDALMELNAEFPQLEIELLSNNSHIDFARMEADVFVRPALTLHDDMIGEAACDLVFQAYGVREDLRKWFRLKGPLTKSAAAEWMSQHVPEQDLISGADSFVVLSHMAQTGRGIAVLPTFVGDRAAGLRHLKSAMPEMSAPIWVGAHRDMKDSPRIRAVRKKLVGYLSAAVGSRDHTSRVVGM